jgi:hypothetical protein
VLVAAFAAKMNHVVSRRRLMTLIRIMVFQPAMALKTMMRLFMAMVL